MNKLRLASNYIKRMVYACRKVELNFELGAMLKSFKSFAASASSSKAFDKCPPYCIQFEFQFLLL